MIFSPSFRRQSSFAAYAVGPSWLTIFLLSSRLCFLASSYSIDDSCRNYKGHDISGDMQRAIDEVHKMAINAEIRISRGDPSTIQLLKTLFGRDPARYDTVRDYLASFNLHFPTSDFVVICDDLMVNIEPDPSTDLPDPRGRWVDPVHAWHLPYDEYRPCNPLRKPGLAAGHEIKGACIIELRYIYLCPSILDLPKGRSLAPYKDQVLAGKWIDDYILTPVSLFHELLHTLLPAQIVEAYGFPMCHQLAYESPDLAVRNADNVALCALGLYLSRCDWDVWGKCVKRSQRGPKVRRDTCEESNDLVRKSCEEDHVS